MKILNIQNKLNKLAKKGGKVTLKSDDYSIYNTLFLDSSSSCLDGEIWACNTDPNGVFESFYGTKLRSKTNLPILKIGNNCNPISGSVVKNLGFQGNLVGMDTRKITDFNNLQSNSGLVLDKVRTDQCEFTKLSFCGLSNGILVCDNAEVDANTFDKINTDGCGNGVYFAPCASYYARFNNLICADNPYYGFYAKGNETMHNLSLTNSIFVRNGGCFTNTDEIKPSAVLFNNVNKSEISNCLFDSPGTFWYYYDTDVSNDARKPSYQKTVALTIIGNENRIRDNTFLNSSAESIIVNGNNNVLINNIVDGNVVIEGENNKIHNLVFTTENSKLILKGKAINSTEIFGINDKNIIKK